MTWFLLLCCSFLISCIRRSGVGVKLIDKHHQFKNNLFNIHKNTSDRLKPCYSTLLDPRAKLLKNAIARATISMVKSGRNGLKMAKNVGERGKMKAYNGESWVKKWQKLVQSQNKWVTGGQKVAKNGWKVALYAKDGKKGQKVTKIDEKWGKKSQVAKMWQKI